MLTTVLHPGECQLPGSDTALVRELVQRLDDRQVVLQVLAGEPRLADRPEVVGLQRVGDVIVPAAEPAAER